MNFIKLRYFFPRFTQPIADTDLRNCLLVLCVLKNTKLCSFSHMCELVSVYMVKIVLGRGRIIVRGKSNDFFGIV